MSSIVPPRGGLGGCLIPVPPKPNDALPVMPSRLTGCCTIATRSEVLLTADEAAAILSNGGTKSAYSTTADATPEAEPSSGASGATSLTAREAESRREAEALEVLLANPGGRGGGGVPGGLAAESALTRLAARYLVRETVRGKIPDPVGNFHVRILHSVQSTFAHPFFGGVRSAPSVSAFIPLPPSPSFGDAAALVLGP